MRFVLIFICVFCTLAAGYFDERRLIDQVNNLNRELSYVISDVSRLMRNFESINQTISKNKGNRKLSNDETFNDTVTDGRKPDHWVSFKAFAKLLKAFESEKRLNRELQLQILALEKRIETEESRSNKLEDSYIDIQKEIKIETQLRQRVQNDLENIEDNVSEIHRDVVKNMTIIMECRDRMSIETSTERPKETTTDISRMSSFLDVDDKDVGITTLAIILTSCRDVPSSGVYQISFSSSEKTRSVFCDADTDEGGWIVTMRRQDGSENFTRTWKDYKNGFGNVEGEFWIGNDILHELTKTVPRELRVDMETFDGNKTFAKYEQFRIGSEAARYILSVSGYSGTAGDSLIEDLGLSYGTHNKMKFATIDNGACAPSFLGGWWYGHCFQALLTGPYSQTMDIAQWKGIIWYPLTGGYKSLKFVEMKIR